MKKKIQIIAMLCLFGTAAFAQSPPPFNTTLMHPDYDFYHGDIALPEPQGEIILGASVRDVNTGEDKYILSRFGPSGNYLPPSLVRDSSYNLDCIMETSHGNFVGVVVASELGNYLLVRKYDLSLNLIWSIKVYKANPMQFSSLYSNVKIEVEKDPAGNDLNYYIVFTSGPNDAAYTQDNAISIAKIDINGALSWHKVYTDVNRGTYSGNIIRDKPNSITSFPDPSDPGQNLYAVAGSREFYNVWPTLSSFYMVIDPAGNIVTQYTDVELATPHYYIDIVYDNDSLAISCLHTNINNQPSGYAIMKTDIGLTSFRGKAYTNECENYAHSISYDGTDYIIGGWAGPCVSPSTSTVNSSLLRIDKNTLAATDYKRFNIYQHVTGNHHRTEMPFYGDHFVTGFTENTYTPWGTRAIRLIKTDNGFITCGETDMNVQPADIDPTIDQLEYEGIEYFDWDIVECNEMEIFLEYDVCTENGSQDFYKPATTGLANSIKLSNVEVEVFPTVVNNAGTPVMCKIATEGNLNVSINVYNMKGQVVSTQSQNVTEGESILRVNTSSVNSGIHIIEVRGDSKVLTTQKVNFMN